MPPERNNMKTGPNPFDRLFKDIYDSLEDSVKKQEFLELFEKLTKRIVSVREELSGKIAETGNASGTSVKELRKELNEVESSLKLLLTQVKGDTELSLTKKMEKAVENLATRMSEIETRIPELPDYTSVFDDLSGKLSRLEELTLGENTRNALEALPEGEKLAIEAVEGLREELDEIWDELEKQKRRVVVSGTVGQNLASWPRHEAFTMDGVATSVTLQQGVGANGNALIVRYQGQTLDMTTHYTVSGNQITLVGFTPASGDIISVTYWS